MTFRAPPLAAWLAFLAGCGNGQTGSIGMGQEEPPPGVQPPCGVLEERTIEPTERVVFQNGTGVTPLELQTVLATVLGQSIQLHWSELDTSAGDNPAPLTLSALALSDARVVERLNGQQTLCGERHLIVTAAFHLRTDDGLFDADVSGPLTLGSWTAGATLPDASLGFLGTASVRIAPALRERFAVAPDARLDGWQVRWTFVPVAPPNIAGTEILGELLDPSMMTRASFHLLQLLRELQDYPAPAAFAAICKAAEPTAVRSFAEQNGFLAAVSKRWARCAGRANFEPDHEGIAIADGRTWRHLTVTDGVFVDRLGFDHEGVIELGEGYVEGTYRMTMHYANGRGVSRGLSESGNTLRIATDGGRHFGVPEIQGPAISDFTYVAVDLTVLPAEPSYADGTRAGAAACEGPQAHVRQQFASADELRALLLGTWSFCGDGRLQGTAPATATAIAFDVGDRYRYLNSAGQSLAAADFTIEAPPVVVSGFRVHLLNAAGAFEFHFDPWISDAPRMLWANDFETLLSAEP